MTDLGARWRQAMAQETPLLMPCAHDGLSARLIAQAGFTAYSIGGFPLVGARYGLPDVGLVGMEGMRDGMRDIIAASSLPVLLDGDDGYGDEKNVARTIRTYESLGAAAMFIEDQVAPKRCGHMAGKRVVDCATMVRKIAAAAAARQHNIFLIARTDARALEGLDGALKRAEAYLKAGADGIFVEAPESVAELERVGAEFRHVPQIANMLEDGRTPIFTPAKLGAMGFAMIAYPTTVIFRVARAIERGLADLKAQTLDLERDGLSFARFKQMTGFDDWAKWEQR